jgi:hypothetical protein
LLVARVVVETKLAVVAQGVIELLLEHRVAAHRQNLC